MALKVTKSLRIFLYSLVELFIEISKSCVNFYGTKIGLETKNKQSKQLFLF